MSVWFGKFMIPTVEESICEAPKEAEVLYIRDVGLDPTEWLVVRNARHLPCLLLQKKGSSLLRTLVWL